MNYPATGLLLAFLSFPPAVFGQSEEQHHHADTVRAEQYGSVHFPISCSGQVQQNFERGVAMLHSFEYEDADATFIAVAHRDPNCAMAYWGQAVSYYHPHWQPPDAAHLKLGREASERAVAIGGKTPREKEYITAIVDYYRQSERLDSRTCALNYQKAMEHLYTAYPDDREAALFYALQVIANAPPRDSSYAEQKKAGAILEKIFAELPNHPGVAHYIMLTTTQCWPTARSQQHEAMPRLHLLRSTLCTCRLISSFKWDRGKKLSRPISPPWPRPVLGWPGPGARNYGISRHTPRITSPMPTCKLDRISLQETFAMKLAATPTGSEKPPGQRTRRSWGFLLVTHWSGISGLRPRRSRFEKFQCPCMKPKPISPGRSAARAQAISPVRGPMLTSSRSFVIDCRKEIKVGRATPTWWKYSICRPRRGWPMRKSARLTLLG